MRHELFVSSQLLAPKAKEESQQQTEQLVGLPLKRREDPRIVAGRTRYVDDIKLPGMLFASVLRSTYAHAKIRNIDLSAALRSPGVVRILLAKDLPKHSSLLPSQNLEDGSKIERPILARGEACYVGEPIAFIVAESRYQAEDALEKVEIDYEPLSAVVDPEVALRDESPKTHSGLKSNLVLVDSVQVGDVDSAFERASKIVKVDLLNQRLSPAPMEPRASIASYDRGSEVLSFWISTKGPFQSRTDLSNVLNLP